MSEEQEKYIINKKLSFALIGAAGYVAPKHMKAIKDVGPGSKFGRLTIISFSHITKYYQRMWNCICECGNKKIIREAHLTHNKIISCGCHKNELHTTHGKYKTKAYKIYYCMLARCYNKDHHKFLSYGARGIKVCDRWLESFENFFEDMGEKPKGLSLERKDNNGSYSPDNCKWASLKEQQRNRRTNKIITFNGESRCLAEWAEKVGITEKALQGRLYRGWDAGKALTTPMR